MTPLQEKYETLVQAAEAYKAAKTPENTEAFDDAAIRFIMECQDQAFNCLNPADERKTYEALRAVKYWEDGISGFKPIYERLREAEEYWKEIDA